MRNPIHIITIALATIVLICSCKSTTDNSGDVQEVPEPVDITHVMNGNISYLTELNATSQYLKDHTINAPIAGYITAENCVPGSVTTGGDILFKIKTREAKALDQTDKSLAGNLDLKGITEIKAGTPGYISQVFHQAGDYVAEGENLATIKETGSLVFILNLPYEWIRHVHLHMPIQLKLPDNRMLKGEITNMSPSVDPVSQTQKVYIKVSPKGTIPEGLTARVYLPLDTRVKTQVLPRSAILTNETETEFWVMKMVNDSTAVKVLITPGLQNRDSIEVKSPEFSSSDRILISGNYAVPDTILVKVNQ